MVVAVVRRHGHIDAGDHHCHRLRIDVGVRMTVLIFVTIIIIPIGIIVFADYLAGRFPIG